MNLYLVTQNVNNGYDTYDGMVVSAASESDARIMHPSKYTPDCTPNEKWQFTYAWCMPHQTCVEYLGPTDKPHGVILASFNAG